MPMLRIQLLVMSGDLRVWGEGAVGENPLLDFVSLSTVLEDGDLGLSLW